MMCETYLGPDSNNYKCIIFIRFPVMVSFICVCVKCFLVMFKNNAYLLKIHTEIFIH